MFELEVWSLILKFELEVFKILRLKFELLVTFWPLFSLAVENFTCLWLAVMMFFVWKVYKVQKKVQTSSPENFKQTSTMSSSNHSFSSVEDEVSKVVKTKVTALVGVLNAPRKAQSVRLNLRPEDNSA